MKPILWKYFDTISHKDIAPTLQTWREQQPEIGILAFVCEQEREGVALLQEAATDAGMPLAGAVVPGLMADARFQRRGVLLLAFDAASPRQIVPLPRAGNRTVDLAVEALADFVETHAGEDRADTLLLLVDAMTPDVASLLDRLYLKTGDQVNYAGTSVGSETFQPILCLFDNETFLQDAVLAMLLPRHPGAVLAHHYRGDDDLRVATATAGNRIKTIDGRPAFEVYRELMASEYGIHLDRESFYRYAAHFPFALSRAQGESLVRIPVVVEDDGSVFCVGEVPENALLSVVRAVEPGSLETAHELASSSIASGAAGVLAFYCAGRLMHLGEEAATAELAALAGELAPTPLFGALSLGEIGCTGQRKYPAFQNATIVALPWP